MAVLSEVAVEKDLKDDEPRRVIGVKGAKSRPFSKKFRNQAHMEKWFDSDEAGNHEVHYIQREEMEKSGKKIIEDSDAAGTLVAGGGAVDSDPRTKSQILSAMIGDLARVDDETLSKLHAAVLDQIGHESDAISADFSASNKASIEPKGSPLDAQFESDLTSLLSSGEGLSEEFSSKAAVLFEAAVSAKVAVRTAEIEEELREENEAAVEAATEKLVEKLDAYLDLVVEEWLAKNEVAIESTARAALAEEFITDLREVFLTHNVDIPESKVDAVEELSERVEELDALLSSALVENAKISEALESVLRDKMVEEASEGLTKMDAARLATLAEGVEFENLEQFGEKLSVLRESISKKGARPSSSTVQLDEAFNGSSAGDDSGEISESMKALTKAFEATIERNSL